MAEWSARQTCNAAALQLAGFALSHPEFKSSATLVNSQMVAS